MKKIIYASGQHINELIFIEELPIKIQPSGGAQRMAIMKCKCGNQFKVRLSNCVKGKTINCQECSKKATGLRSSTHGLSRDKLYGIWCDIKKRCYCTSGKNYKNYGAKGIKMHESWIDDFKSFYNYVTSLESYSKDMIGKGKNKLSIDRIDCMGDYEPKNIRFTDVITQNLNKPNQINNNTGYNGISKRRCGTFQVSITYNRTSKIVGSFKTISEAVEKRNAYLKELGIFEYYEKYNK